jgi:hypothetical protein
MSTSPPSPAAGAGQVRGEGGESRTATCLSLVKAEFGTKYQELILKCLTKSEQINYILCLEDCPEPSKERDFMTEKQDRNSAKGPGFLFPPGLIPKAAVLVNANPDR